VLNCLHPFVHGASLLLTLLRCHAAASTLRAGRNSNGNRSPLLRVGFPHGAAAAAAAAAAGDRPQSVYLEHSLEDSELLVMRTMSDWSQDEVDGSASQALELQQQQGDQMLQQQMRTGGGSYHRSRSQKMPLIEEGEGEAGSEEQEEKEVEGEARPQQQHQQQQQQSQ
jgi:hypothetical protein